VYDVDVVLLVVRRWASKALVECGGGGAGGRVSWGSLLADTRGGGLTLLDRHDPLRDRLNIFNCNNHTMLLVCLIYGIYLLV